ncbi:nuclear egress membrane protein [Bovine herpesvirus type 1.2 strain SM023]|uniref:Nuclear egress membrane protein n=3 Tax=Bovine herpesvirus type 1.2 TaxID=79890 RepID=A0A089N8A8_BHV1|nr:nuclear egress membrane protein [Bovine herpesvirus type 1.2 strain K22]AIQ80746.1 nuclear egress membrane protein [Bovine herpesvirus type 1.2 strain SM023]AIQ80816.1 nuclear egress membrane protein [Bovine herpesvirus type 1.2 strain SP1777]AVM39245.1 nuclear egress protein 2 [Bovine alphaherpesvirus 1]UOW86818.1 MAG: UL34 protein [Bovine alphaherpesvirus 1]
MHGRERDCDGEGEGEGSSRSLMARIRLLVAGNLQCGEGDVPQPWDPRRPPARCVFQFNGQDGSNESFPLEYILRLMASWAQTDCDPYVRVQNTGVSVLFQGYFSRPPGAPLAAITAEQNNATLASTQSTGLSLSALEKIKARGGIDPRPFRAMMSVSCFVRMPRVQLSFRFMGPGDSHRTGRLLDRAVRERLSERDVRSRRASACGHGERELEPAGGAKGAAGNVAHYAGALLTARRQKMAALATLVGGVCGILAILRLFWAPS